MNDWHTCKASGDIRASNPCSEYMFLDDTACNLASANLITFYSTTTKRFDVDAYEHLCRLWTVVLEISVMMAQFPSKAIAELSYEFRTLGLGFANIGGLLMTMGLPYDTQGRPRAVRRPDRDHDRHCLCDLGRDGQGARPLPRLQEERARTCCA